MKKIYLLTLAMLIAVFAIGQNSFNNIKNSPVKSRSVIQSNTSGAQLKQNLPPTAQAVIWSDDFSTPGNWTINNDVGNSDNWVIGTAGPACQYAIAPIASTSAANGFALFDSDCLCSGNQIGNITTASSINLTGKASVRLEFQQYHRRYFDSTFVYVSTNNSTWVKYPVNTTYANNAYSGANPTLTSVDISATAGNQATVWIRFTFYSPSSLGASAGCGYSWMVDDVQLLDGPANDLKLVDKYYYTYSDVSSKKYYTRIPSKQSLTDTLVFGSYLQNNGSAAQPNTKFSVNITGTQTATLNSTNITLASGAIDSLNVSSDYVLAAKGNYYLNFSVSSDSTDFFVSDNSMKDTVIVTDSVYARDNGLPSSGVWYNQQTDGTYYIIANLFRIGEQDSMTSMSLYIPNFAAPYSQVGRSINFQLYDFNGTDPVLMASNDFYDIQQFDLGTWKTVGLTPVAPYTSTSLTPGWYLVAYEALSDTLIITTGAGDPPAPDFTTFVSLEGVWYYTDNIPFLRMNTKYACSATVSSTNTNVSCNGGNDGAINLTLSGAQGPFTYSWSNGATTEDLTGLAPGSYTVTITFGGTCSVTGGPYSITQPQALAAATSATGTCSGSTNGTATATPSGGTAPYSYLWSNGQTGQTANNLAAGSYTVTVTDSKNCTTTGSATVVAVTVAATAAATNTSCGLNNGSALASATGGTSPYTYLWSNAQTTASITGLAAGTYTVTITDNATCTGTAIATISASSGVTVSTSSTNAACGASDGTATVDSPTGTAYTYLWSNGQTTAQATALGAGTYSVTVTDTVGGCSGTATASVNNTGAATLSAAETDVTCNGASTGAVNITVTGGTSPLTYLWNNGATTEDVTGLAAGTYIITVTGNDGCASTSTSVISEPAAITSSVAATNASCNGGTDGSVNLLASGGTGTLTYLWSNGATTEDISGVGAGTYTVVIMDANSCADTASATVAEPSAINLSYAVTDAVGNTGAVNLTATGGTGSLSYLWSNGATTEDISGLAPGTYSVVVTDANGCTSDTSATVLSTGISEEKVNTSFSIFPNPNRGVFNVQFNNGKGQYSLMLRNVIGQVIYSERVVINGNASRHIDLSNVGQGIYFLTVSGDDVSKTQKVTIK